MNIKKILFGFLLLCSTSLCVAQEVLWTTKVAHDWHRITSLGYVIVGSPGRLYGIDPQTGNRLWEKKELGTVQEIQIEEIWGTSLIKVAYNIEEGEDAQPMIAVVDVVTGKIVFDSNAERLGVLGTYVLDRSGKFLVVGVKPGEFSARLLMYDLNTGNMLWKNEDIFKASAGGKGGMLGKMAAAVKTVINMQALIAPPIELDNESLAIVHPGYIIRLKSADGQVVWKTAIDESVTATVTQTPYQPDNLFVGAQAEMVSSMVTGTDGKEEKRYSTTYYAIDVNSGRQVWKTKPISESLNITLPMEQGLAVFYKTNPKATANLLDYKTGAGLWGNKGKGLKTQGSVTEYIATANGIVLSSAGEGGMVNRGEEYFLNVLDEKSGTFRFEKSVKVKGALRQTEIIPKGILYITTHEVNILDPASGALVLSSSIESEAPKRNTLKPFPTANTDSHLYVFATKSGNLMELEKKTGTVRKVNAAPITFGGKELPKAIDVFDDGVVLSSDQNIMMFGFDGTLKHTKYYLPPNQSGWQRAMALAEAVKGVYAGAMIITASVMLNDAASSVQNPELKNQAKGAAIGLGSVSVYAFAYAGLALKEFNRRVKATTATDEYILLLTEPVKKDIKLIQVDKRTGQVLTTLDIGKDREPQYSVDFIDRKVYYLSAANEITCFQLK